KTIELPKELKSDETADKEQSEEESEKSFEAIKEVVTTNFKSSRARFYEGVVRSGKTVESDGHLVLVGDVEEGGKIAAVGNVVIAGSLKGRVEAGCMGNDKAYVIALDFEPEEVRIAKTRHSFEKSEFAGENKARKAYLSDGFIYTEEFWS
ncbi:MAG: septum site-determining protein MinC, partial [Hominilimicola sp.]